jgi:hypothetical protein
MKKAVLGFLVAVVLFLAVSLFDRPNTLSAERSGPATAASGGNVIAVPSAIGEKGQLLTVIDPQQQAMGVYHIELPSGKIKLLSARNIRYDMQMTNFNNEAPLPQEIRAMLEQR